ncbi:MAG: Nramp family divalent metal transporter [Planctomycetaceae bacterium]|nr:Nramp family divalent metal transporter [Planctomycetaceae bacterium]
MTETDRPATPPVDLYSRSADVYLEPPEGLLATFRHLGPGLILVGSIVGSGELILTTRLGAQAGFVLMWFVILSCLLKVVVQAELVRHTISSGETFLEAFSRLPGPAVLRPRWFTFGWLGTVSLASFAAATIAMRQKPTPLLLLKLAAGVALCGVAAAFVIGWMRKPVTGEDAAAPGTAAVSPPRMNWFLWCWMLCQLGMFINGGAILGGAAQAVQLAFPAVFGEHGAQVWAVVVGVVCAILLTGGGYRFLERLSFVLVAGFTFITVICTFLLQRTEYAITPQNLLDGLTFSLPVPLEAGVVLPVLGVFAATGIGHWEMLSYTYWCIEKGYARAAGARTEEAAWQRRAAGWVRVMYIDSWATFVVYTSSTICFYLLGAAILHARGEDPAGIGTLLILQNVYTSSLGPQAAALFIAGAFCVLFSTTVSGTAANSRIMADAASVFGFIQRNDTTGRLRLIRIAIVGSLLVNSYAYYLFEDPTLMLLVSGTLAVFMYPALGLGALWLRYRGVDPRLQPGPAVTAALWFCGLSLAVIAPLMAVVSLALSLGWKP